jgi:hypothetical protein
VWKHTRSGAWRDWRGLVAFVSVLATGIVLITVGHLTAAEVTSLSGALAALFAAFTHWRPPPPNDPSAGDSRAASTPGADPADPAA